jgi:hypothetical protein
MAGFHMQDHVREKYPNLRHYNNYAPFAALLFKNCKVLGRYEVRPARAVLPTTCIPGA